MTDDRFGEDLLPAIRRLRSGSGVIFRHYDLDDTARRSLFGQLRKICRQRGHMLLLGRDQSRRHYAGGQTDFIQGPAGASRCCSRSAAVHNRCRISTKRCATAQTSIFISPIFATGSHPDGKVLGRLAI